MSVIFNSFHICFKEFGLRSKNISSSPHVFIYLDRLFSSAAHVSLYQQNIAQCKAGGHLVCAHLPCLKYAREFDADRNKLRRHCCSECYQTQGLTHNKHCARIPLEIHATEETANKLQQHCLNIFKTRTCRGEYHFRKHIRSTAECSRMRERSRSPHVATIVDAHTCGHTTTFHRCILVSLGRYGRKGNDILYANPSLGPYVVDVSTKLKDKNVRGGPWGTHPLTQKRISEMPEFGSILTEVLGKILILPPVLVVCNHGHHRSVAVVEIAAKRIKAFQSQVLTLETIHVDADRCSDAQLNMLLRFPGQ